MSEFLNIPLFDDDFFKMVFRFFLNTIFLTIIIQWLYYKSVKKRDLNSKLVRRRGRVYIINKTNPKFKARQK